MSTDNDTTETARILSIDAWRQPEGWTWNAWYKVGEINRATLASLTTNRAILRYLRSAGYLTDYSKGRVGVEDDGYNLTVYQRGDGQPLLAIEYGPVYGI